MQHAPAIEAVEAVEPDLFGDEVFSSPPAADHAATWGDEEPEVAPRVAPDKRRAMFATWIIFGVLATAVGGFTVYSKIIMPTPVALGVGSTLTLPAAYDDAPTMPAAAEAPPTIAPHVEPAPSATTSDPLPTIIAEPAPPAVPVQKDVTRAPRASKPRSANAAEVAPAAEASLGARAMRELNAGRPQAAKVTAQQADAQEPTRADGWIVLGAAHDALGDHAAALTAYATCTARAFGPRVATCRALAR